MKPAESEIRLKQQLAQLAGRMVFNVANPDRADTMKGIPLLAQKTDRYGLLHYVWAMPPMGCHDFELGWELGLATLRAKRWPGGLTHQDAFRESSGDLVFIAEAMHQDARAPKEARAGFFACLDVFQDYALNAPTTVFMALLARLDALDDGAFRTRCLTILDGQNPPDIFNPEGLGFTK